MVQIFGLVAIVAIVGVVLWIFTGAAEASAAAAPVRWMVELEEGRVSRFEGAFPPPGWRDVHEIAQARSVTGIIRFRHAGAIDFSEGITEDDRQSFRNVLARGPASGCLPGPKG